MFIAKLTGKYPFKLISIPSQALGFSVSEARIAGTAMHMNKTCVVLDVLPIQIGQEIILPSGRLGVVSEIGRLFVTFSYADAPRQLTARQMEDWTVEVPRRIVADILNGAAVCHQHPDGYVVDSPALGLLTNDMEQFVPMTPAMRAVMRRDAVQLIGIAMARCNEGGDKA